MLGKFDLASYVFQSGRGLQYVLFDMLNKYFIAQTAEIPLSEVRVRILSTQPARLPGVGENSKKMCHCFMFSTNWLIRPTWLDDINIYYKSYGSSQVLVNEYH